MGSAECCMTKGGVNQDGRVIVPGSGAAPLSGPKGTISRSMHLLKTDHVRLNIAKKAEYKSATGRGGHALHVKGQGIIEVKNTESGPDKEKPERNEVE